MNQKQLHLNPRIDWVDFGKGFTIFLVVLGHVFLGLYQSNRFVNHNDLLWLAIQTVYIFHIPVFFALSGYFFKAQESMSSYVTFALKKTLQLGIPYIFYNIIQFILQSLGGSSVREAASFSDLLQIYKTPLSVSWFLYVLWGIFILLGFLSIWIKKKSVLFGLTLLMLVTVNVFPSDLMIVQRVGLWASVFMLGSLLREVTVKHAPIFMSGLGLSILVYLVIWYQFDFANRISYSQPKVWGIIFFLVVPFAFMAFARIPVNRFKSYFVNYGKDSLVIYILHAPIVSVARILLLKLGMSNVWLHIGIGLLAGWFGSLFAIYLMTKIPYVDFVFYPTRYIKLKK